MFSLFGRQIFKDPPVPLTSAREHAARYAATRAAREARRSLRTSRGQYRRYRATAGEHYLDWPRWRAEYLREYRGGGTVDEGGTSISAPLYGGGLGPP
ncbi:hypothetical protein L2K20_07510 [Mycobacterium sp. MBM]|nr:hypothetical protein [Mycobacterium sp. MBM]